MKFRKKPVIIEAVQWRGDNIGEISKFMHPTIPMIEEEVFSNDPPKIAISTLEGIITASVNDWIIRGVSKELYPCKPDIFEKTYEPVEE